MSAIDDRPTEAATSTLRRISGRREDWHLRPPHFSPPQPSLAWAGPTTIVISLAVPWLAFKDAVGVSLVDEAERAARLLGATSIDREDFDVRQGFGPDLSRDIDALITTVRSR